MSKSSSNGSEEQGPIEIIPAGSAGHSIDITGLPRSALAAIINELNKKSQKIGKGFEGNYRINLSSLGGLISKIDDEFSNCRILSKSCSVDLSLEGKQRQQFNGSEALRDFEKDISETTSSVEVELIYDVFRSDQTIPERYTVQVSISNLPASVKRAIMQIPFFGTSKFPSIMCTIQFANYVLGKNILSAVESWERTLSKRTRKAIDFSQRYSHLIPQAGKVVGMISGFAISYRLIDYLALTESSSNANLALWALTSAAITYALMITSIALGRYSENMIDSYEFGGNLIITTGDKRREEEESRDNRKITARVAIAASFILLQLALGVSASYIFNALQ